MEFSALKHKKLLMAGALMVLIILGYLLATRLIGKVDDWRYSYTTPANYLLPAGIIVALLFIFWLASSIFLIASGKPLLENNRSKPNPRRIAGLYSLLGSIALLILSLTIFYAMLRTYTTLILLLIPLLLLAFLVFGIIYSIRNHVKIAILPLLVVPVILVAAIASIYLLPGFGMLGAKMMSSFSDMASGNLGFSVGGAKDINNFRQNVQNNYLPLSTDITYEGLFYDYYFDTGEKKACTKLFCPSYSSAISKDPLSNQDEYYLSVGLNSNIKESDFQRKKLNLVIVLDISGSMGSPFNQYYYDQFGDRQPIEGIENDTDFRNSKMQVATKSIVALLGHLNPDDRFGMVLYDESAYLAKPLRKVADTDLESIKAHILDIGERGSTNFEAGYTEGTSLFDSYLDADQSEYENRIIFLTDAMPNTGNTDENSLLGLTRQNSENKIYTTFIGIGVDFNTELIEYITKIRGANYYSVHSSTEFKNRMDAEFEYMVTPLVFNLLLTLDAPGYKIDRVYGSPEANEATGEIMKVNTLFPSKQEDGKTRGGLVLLKLRKVSADDNLRLSVSYEDRLGNTQTEEQSFQLLEKTSDTYDNLGIRKGILLARYANLMKDWISDERESIDQDRPLTPVVNRVEGIVLPPRVEPAELGRWERQSVPLQVSPQYKGFIADFKLYFDSEMDIIKDTTLSRESEVLRKLEIYQG